MATTAQKAPSGLLPIGATTGLVVQISVSSGGVPKLRVPRAIVTPDGLAGDAQSNTKFHGGADRALCIWGEEIIDMLRGEGHNLAPGYTGENLTIRGINWNLVQPGVALHIGDSVEAVVTSFTRPCKTNARWFRGGDYGRISQVKHPGWSRVYARVLRGGNITEGCAVVLDVETDR